MKKMISTVCAIVACATTLIAQDTVCRLSGSIPDESFNGKKIYIVNFDNNQPLDSAVIKNGKFAFSTKTTGTALPAALAIEGRKVASFIFEPGNLSINEKGQVLGSPLNDKNEAISANLDSLYNNYREKMRQLSRSGKPANEMMAEAEKYQAETSAAIGDYLETKFAENKDNAIGYGLFMQIADGMTVAEIDSMLAESPEWMKNSNIVKSYKKMAESLEKTAAGKMFTDFEITTSNGTKKKLSDYVGKSDYVLLDFFASWCGPCMREMPTLKKIYEKYNGKGLTMVGVAVWDEPDDTRRCIEEQQIPWAVIDNAQTIPTDIYGVRGIPHIVVFAPDGTIAFRGLVGEQLAAEIDKLLAK